MVVEGDLRAIGPPAPRSAPGAAMASFPSRQSALPGGCLNGKSPGGTRQKLQRLSPNTSNGLAAMGDRSGECRGDEQGLQRLAGWGPPTGRPGRSRGLLSGQATPPISHQPAANRWPTMRRPSFQGASIRRTSGRATCSAAATRPAKTGAQHHHINELSLGGSGLFRVTASLGQAPRRVARCSRPLQARRAPQDRGPHGSACRSTKQAGAGRQGLGVPSPGPGRRPRFPSGGCRVSPAGRGGGDWPQPTPLHGASRRGTPTTGGPPPGPARREAVRSRGRPNSPSFISEKAIGLPAGRAQVTASRGGSGQFPLAAAPAHRRRLGRRQCLLPAARAPLISSAPRRAALPTARPWWLDVVEFQHPEHPHGRGGAAQMTKRPTMNNSGHQFTSAVSGRRIHQPPGPRRPLGNRAPTM